MYPERLAASINTHCHRASTSHGCHKTVLVPRLNLNATRYLHSIVFGFVEARRLLQGEKKVSESNVAILHPLLTHPIHTFHLHTPHPHLLTYTLLLCTLYPSPFIYLHHTLYPPYSFQNTTLWPNCPLTLPLYGYPLLVSTPSFASTY